MTSAAPPKTSQNVPKPSAGARFLGFTMWPPCPCGVHRIGPAARVHSAAGRTQEADQSKSEQISRSINPCEQTQHADPDPNTMGEDLESQGLCYGGAELARRPDKHPADKPFRSFAVRDIAADHEKPGACAVRSTRPCVDNGR